MSDDANPFWNANAAPDRMATAILGVAFWLLVAGSLLVFAPGPVSVVVAALLTYHALRMWRRFRARTPTS